MGDDVVVPFAQGTAKILTLSGVRDSAAWKRAFQSKCKDHRYYELIDETLANDFEFRYALLEDSSGNIRAIQPVFFVQQNLVEGMRGAFRKAVDRVRKTFPRFLTMRVLMVGCAAGTGELGAFNANDEHWTAEALGATLRNYARENNASLVVLKDFPASYRSTLAALSENGYARVPSMPMTRLELPYQNFDEYLETLGYVSRKSLRRKFRKTERAAKIEMEVVNDISACIDAIYPLYLQNSFVASVKSCRNRHAFSSGDSQTRSSRSVCVLFAATRFTMNASASITMSRSISIFIFTPCAT